MNAHKIFTSLLIFVFAFSNAAVFAQVPVAVPGVMTAVGDLSRIGVVAAIQGKVEVMTPGAAGRVVQSGEEIFIGDEVQTDAMGHLQILLLDETVFTIGPNSAIIIDKFIYDPKTQAGNVEASITKGVFRYVSGKIAAKKPENVTINLPTATIGIRGTIIAGEISATGSMAMLVGPGSRNETGATIGSFVMNGVGANVGDQEHVNRTGFGVTADQGGNLSGVFMVPETQVQHLTMALAPSRRQAPMPVAGADQQGTPPVRSAPNQPPAGTVPATDRGVAPAGKVPATEAGSVPTGPVSGTVSGTHTPGSGPMMSTGTFGDRFNAGDKSGDTPNAIFQEVGMDMRTDFMENNFDRLTEIVSDGSRLENATSVIDGIDQTSMSDMQKHFLNSSAIYSHSITNYFFNGAENTFSATIQVEGNVILGTSIFQLAGDSANVDSQDFGVSPLKDQTFATFTWNNNDITPSASNFDTIVVEFQDQKITTADGITSSITAVQAKVIVTYTDGAFNGSASLIARES